MKKNNRLRQQLGLESLEDRRMLASLLSRLPPIRSDYLQEPVLVYDASNQVSSFSRTVVGALQAMRNQVQSGQTYIDELAEILQQDDRDRFQQLADTVADPNLVPSFERATELATQGFTTETALRSPFGQPLSSRLDSSTSDSTLDVQPEPARPDAGPVEPPDVETDLGTGGESITESPNRREAESEQASDEEPDAETKVETPTGIAPDQASSASSLEESGSSELQEPDRLPLVVEEKVAGSTETSASRDSDRNYSGVVESQLFNKIEGMVWLPMKMATVPFEPIMVASGLDLPEVTEIPVIQTFLGQTSNQLTQWLSPLTEPLWQITTPVVDSVLARFDRVQVHWTTAVAVAGLGYAYLLHSKEKSETEQNRIPRSR